MSRVALVIEHEVCWGCKTCEVACDQEYNHEVKFIHVWEDGPTIVDDKLQVIYRANVCQHCDDPPCMEVCPEEAISKRPDGIVVLDTEACSGCRACIEECPYNAIGFDEDEQTALKCNMCRHRVDKGLLPACADNVCLAHCIYFGDPTEISAIIAKKKEKRNTL